MCAKYCSSITPFQIRLAKITVFLIFFLFAECAAGSCLSYGHACWGAHGKRSGSRNNNLPLKDNANTDDDNGLSDSRWFLSRLVQSPLDLRLARGRDYVFQANHEGVDGRALFGEEGEQENDNMAKSPNEPNTSDTQLRDLAKAFDSIYLDDSQSHRHKTSKDRIRFFKIVKRNVRSESI